MSLKKPIITIKSKNLFSPTKTKVLMQKPQSRSKKNLALNSERLQSIKSLNNFKKEIPCLKSSRAIGYKTMASKSSLGPIIIQRLRKN